MHCKVCYPISFPSWERNAVTPQRKHGGAEEGSADARNARHINVHCISGWLTWYARTHVRVRCAPHFKPFDRSASCREIQKGGSPFGRFKGFPKGENEIPLWRALSFRATRFLSARAERNGVDSFALRCMTQCNTNTSSVTDSPCHLPLKGKALKVRSTSRVLQGFPPPGEAVAVGD